MHRLSSALHPERRAAMMDQGGYALMTVLGVIALTSLVITALMGLMITTLRLTDSAEESSRELRALEGAMDVAINQMRFSPDVENLNNDPCNVASPFERVEELSFSSSSAPDVVVDIDCTGSVNTGVESAADQVQLVSQSGYLGDIPWTTNCASGNVGPNCLPWIQGTGSVPSDLSTSRPNLVHAGKSPLRIESGVTVRNGAAALRNPTSGAPALHVAGEYTQGAPGYHATGDNPCGVLAAGGPTSAARVVDLGGSGAPECDSALARAVDISPTDPKAGFETPTNPPPGSNMGIPSNCTAVTVLQPGRYSTAATWELNRLINRNKLANQPPGTDARRGSCANNDGRTFHFLPGVYYFQGPALDFDQRDAYFVLGAPKDWDGAVGVPGSSAARNPQATLCDPDQSGVTFVLSPQTSLRHVSGRFAMCPAFSDKPGQPPLPAIYQETSVPTGVATSDGTLSRTFNCDAATQGSRDVIEGFLGLVRTGNMPRFAIPSLPSGQCRNGRTHTVSMTAMDPQPINSAKVLIRGYENKSTPSNLITNRFTMISVFNANGHRICTTSAQSGVANGQWTNTVDLLTGSCANPRTASNCLNPANGALGTFDPRYPDLAQPPGSSYCRPESALTHESQLNGGHLEITQFLTFLFPLPPLNQQVTIDDVQVVTNSTDATIQAGNVTSPSTGGTFSAPYLNPGNVAGPADFATPTMPCAYILCHVAAPPGTRPTQPFVHELLIEDIDITIPDKYLDAEIDPNLHGLRAMVRLDPSFCPDEPDDRCKFPPNLLFEDLGIGIPDVNQWLKDSFFGNEMTMRMELELAEGKRCVQTSGFVNAPQELGFDLLRAVDGGQNNECAGVVNSYNDLQGASLRMRVQMPCLRNWPINQPWQCISTGSGDSYKVFQVRPPSIQQVRLQLETDSYVGLWPKAVATINATTDAVGSSFNVLGRVWMPRTTLDVRWNGDVTEGRPLFSDQLILGSLGSTILPTGVVSRANDSRYTEADRYILCCEEKRAESRNVRLTASVGERRLQVDVLFTDIVPDPDGGAATYSPGHKVEILDWQTCDRGRCS